jgi:signal transduction histidine kinase
MVITAFVAGTIYRVVAGGPADMGHFHSFRGPMGFLACCLGYFTINTALVAGAVSLEKRARLWETLRKNYLYRNELTSSGTLFALSPILLLSYLSIGYPGVLLFFLPLVIVKEQNRSYIELQRATARMIFRERWAAKGEIAGEIAHEMNNYLAAISGRTQLLQRKIERQKLSQFERDVEVIWDQTDRLIRLAKGLIDFSPPKAEMSHFDLNLRCQNSVDFLKPINLFDDVTIELELDPTIRTVVGDDGQIDQILKNLIRNAAQAMRGEGTENREIRVRTRVPKKGHVQVEVEDNGPGVHDSVKSKVFEPGFTENTIDGHGFGLATCFTIMENHKGRIWVEDRPGGGARFCFAWPSRAEEGKTPRAA